MEMPPKTGKNLQLLHRRGTIGGMLALAAEAAGALSDPFIMAFDQTNEFVSSDRATLVGISACSEERAASLRPPIVGFTVGLDTSPRPLSQRRR